MSNFKVPGHLSPPLLFPGRNPSARVVRILPEARRAFKYLSFDVMPPCLLVYGNLLRRTVLGKNIRR